jgi:nuclear pore complex protein Nup93
MSSLFGGLGGGQPASTGASSSGTPFGQSLFGNAGNAANNTPSGTTPSLFGNLGGGNTGAASGTSQPASTGGLGSSLFGGALGGAKPATPSAFASLGAPATSQPQTQTGGFSSSLFSKPATTQQSTTNNQQQTTGLGQPSLFGGASTQQPPQQQAQQQQGASLSQSHAGTTRSAHFDNLLERGRKRNAGENGGTNFDELPSLQLGLGDIARKVRNLGAGGPSADQVRDGAQDRAA